MAAQMYFYCTHHGWQGLGTVSLWCLITISHALTVANKIDLGNSLLNLYYNASIFLAAPRTPRERPGRINEMDQLNLQQVAFIKFQGFSAVALGTGCAEGSSVTRIQSIQAGRQSPAGRRPNNRVPPARNPGR